MIRRLLRLAAKAVKVEARRWIDPTPAREPEPAPVAHPEQGEFRAPREPSRWESPAFHVEVLASLVCPDCEKPKGKGWYRCQACVALAKAAS